MATYLFAWNPRSGRWQESDDDNLDYWVAELAAQRPVTFTWECQAFRRIALRDKAYFIRLGKAPKGIFGSGTVTVLPTHKGDEVEVEVDRLQPAQADTLLGLDVLQTHPDLCQQHWTIQGSGVRIDDHVAEVLDQIWQSHCDDRPL